MEVGEGNKCNLGLINIGSTITFPSMQCRLLSGVQLKYREQSREDHHVVHPQSSKCGLRVNGLLCQA